MNMKFYMTPGSCSTAIHIILEELEEVFEAHIVNLPAGDQFKPEFLAINPKANIPALMRPDGSVLTEVPAIAYWLGRARGRGKLWPKEMEDETRAMETMSFVVGALHGHGFARIFAPGNFCADSALHGSIKAQGRALVEKGFAILDKNAGRAKLDRGRLLRRRRRVVLCRLLGRQDRHRASEEPAGPLPRHAGRPVVSQVLREEGYRPESAGPAGRQLTGPCRRGDTTPFLAKKISTCARDARFLHDKAAAAAKGHGMTIDEIIENFEFLDDWDDRYRYLIELGRELEPLPAEAHNDANKVRGCASQVWLQTDVERGPDGAPALKFLGDSDAHIVRGLVVLTLTFFSGRPATDIIEADAQNLFKQPRLRAASDAAALQRPALHGRAHQARRGAGAGGGLKPASKTRRGPRSGGFRLLPGKDLRRLGGSLQRFELFRSQAEHHAAARQRLGRVRDLLAQEVEPLLFGQALGPLADFPDCAVLRIARVDHDIAHLFSPFSVSSERSRLRMTRSFI